MKWQLHLLQLLILNKNFGLRLVRVQSISWVNKIVRKPVPLVVVYLLNLLSVLPISRTSFRGYSKCNKVSVRAPVNNLALYWILCKYKLVLLRLYREKTAVASDLYKISNLITPSACGAKHCCECTCNPCKRNLC